MTQQQTHQDKTTPPLWWLWLSDIAAGAGFILFAVVIFFLAGVLAYTPDEPQQGQTQTTMENAQ